ncbi:MAG: hypothetical protein DRQ46_00260 [Gammaproteobacteria bacterium]|nr:MAG: hypothetical protein DRQ46_00260 [Gammaproteobacteria bacterium]
MTEPTPQSNENKIIRLEGRMDTFEAKVEGHVNVQKESAKAVAENVEEIKESQKDFTEKASKYFERLFVKSDEAKTKSTEVSEKLTAHKEVCAEKHQALADSKETSRFSVGMIVTIVIALVGWLLHLM